LAVGALFALFGFLEEGISLAGMIHGVPGFTIIAIALLGRRFPRSAGILLTAAAVGAFFFFHLYLARQIVVLLLIPVPLQIAAVSLFFGRPDSDTDATSSTSTSTV
jgi:hypothetical protein